MLRFRSSLTLTQNFILNRQFHTHVHTTYTHGHPQLFWKGGGQDRIGQGGAIFNERGGGGGGAVRFQPIQRGGDAVHFWPIQSVRFPPSRPIQSFNQRAEGAELLLQGGGHAPPHPPPPLGTPLTHTCSETISH